MIENIKERLSILLSADESVESILKKVCALLHQEIDYYNWVGFYFRDGQKEELVLSSFVGAETDHKRIPFGKGICGQVALSGKTFLVPDVSLEQNYLSCSVETKSEIVVPIIKEGVNIGQIDIDSHEVNPFNNEDKELLEWLCGKVAEIL